MSVDQSVYNLQKCHWLHGRGEQPKLFAYFFPPPGLSLKVLLWVPQLNHPAIPPPNAFGLEAMGRCGEDVFLRGPCARGTWHPGSKYLGNKKTQSWVVDGGGSVDGRNPAPPGMVKNLINNGIIIILRGFLDFVHQQYVLLSPLFGEDEPILTNINIFQSGWSRNHQLEKRWVVWLKQVGSTPKSPCEGSLGSFCWKKKARASNNKSSGIMTNYHPRLIGDPRLQMYKNYIW